MNSNVFRKLSYGVYLVTTLDGARPTGCTANSAMQITSSPATIAVSVNRENFTNPCIRRAGKFALNILAEDTDPALIGGFGFRSGKDVDKFDGVEYETVEGMPVVKDSCGYVVCEVIDTMETETHTVFLGRVVEGDVYGDRPQMTYAYYHKVVKGKSPPKAPTYIPDEPKAARIVWQCSVCGYVYEGDPLPPGYVCPICGVGADLFERVEKK